MPHSSCSLVEAKLVVACNIIAFLVKACLVVTVLVVATLVKAFFVETKLVKAVLCVTLLVKTSPDEMQQAIYFITKQLCGEYPDLTTALEVKQQCACLVLLW